MSKPVVRLGALILSPLGAVALLALVLAGTATAQPPASFSPLLPRSSAPTPLPSPIWRIGVTTDGLYRLSYEMLAAAGVPVTGTATSAVHLLWRGQEVALDEVGDGEGDFEPGEAFLFYGSKFHGSVQDEKYTDEAVYWLAVDAGTAGLRMTSRSVKPGLIRLYLPLILRASGHSVAQRPTVSAQPSSDPWYTATVRAEENTIYWARYSTTPGTSATWFWERVQAVSTVTRTYAITLTAPVSALYTATLRLEVAGRSYNGLASPDHHLRLAVNDAVVGEATWDGEVGAVFTLPVASTALVSGVNQVQLIVLTDLGGPQDVYVDWVEIDYRRGLVAKDDHLTWAAPFFSTAIVRATNFSTVPVYLYDVTYPLTPARLIGADVALSGTSYVLALQDAAAAGTVYLAVTGNAIAEISSPAIYYPPGDLLTPTVGADEVIVAPAQFITALQPLADLRRSQGLRVRVVDVADIYALFNGGVFHPEAIRAFVAHAYAYWPGPPLAYLLLVGDGNFNFKGYNPAVYGAFAPTLIPPYLEFADPDQGEVAVDSRFGDVDGDGMPEVMVGRIPAGTSAEGAVAKILTYESAPPAAWMGRVLLAADDGATAPEGFSQVTEGLARDFIPSAMETRTVYIEAFCPTFPHASCVSATLALTQTWSEGAALLTYAGHGSIHRWGHEKFLLNTQLPSLTGTVGLPFLIALDCWDGYWMFPPNYPAQDATDVRSIGEWATTVLTDRGAIATFGPAGLGYIGLEDEMVRAMYGAMFEEGVFQLGPLVQVAREAISTSYLARTFTLLGDPALTLPWWDHITLTPAVLTMTVGTSTTLSTAVVATGTTRFGRDFIVTPAWTAAAGTLDAWTVFTAPQYVTVTYLTAHLGPVSAQVTLNVVAGQLAARAPGEPSLEIPSKTGIMQLYEESRISLDRDTDRGLGRPTTAARARAQHVAHPVPRRPSGDRADNSRGAASGRLGAPARTRHCLPAPLSGLYPPRAASD